MDKYKRDHSVIKLLQIVSAISFILCVVFIILLILSRNSDIQLWYSRYLEYLASAEYKVEHMSEKFSVFLIVIFLYAFKAVFPIYLYPVSALCAVTSAVFPSYFSIPINLLGLSVLYSVKYFWGTKVGANGVQNILQKSESILGNDDIDFTVAMDEICYPLHPQVGQQLETVHISMSLKSNDRQFDIIKITIKDRSITGRETVTVPAGTFDCWTVNETEVMKTPIGMGTTTQSVTWYAEGIGEVKSQTLNKRGKLEESSELVSIAVVRRRSEERRVGKECRSRWSPYH